MDTGDIARRLPFGPGRIEIRDGREPRGTCPIELGLDDAAERAGLGMIPHHIRCCLHPLAAQPVVVVDEADDLAARFLNPAGTRVRKTGFRLADNAQRRLRRAGPQARHVCGSIGGPVIDDDHFPSQ